MFQRSLFVSCLLLFSAAAFAMEGLGGANYDGTGGAGPSQSTPRKFTKHEFMYCYELSKNKVYEDLHECLQKYRKESSADSKDELPLVMPIINFTATLPAVGRQIIQTPRDLLMYCTARYDRIKKVLQDTLVKEHESILEPGTLPIMGIDYTDKKKLVVKFKSETSMQNIIEDYGVDALPIITENKDKGTEIWTEISYTELHVPKVVLGYVENEEEGQEIAQKLTEIFEGERIAFKAPPKFLSLYTDYPTYEIKQAQETPLAAGTSSGVAAAAGSQVAPTGSTFVGARPPLGRTISNFANWLTSEAEAFQQGGFPPAATNLSLSPGASTGSPWPAPSTSQLPSGLHTPGISDLATLQQEEVFTVSTRRTSKLIGGGSVNFIQTRAAAANAGKRGNPAPFISGKRGNQASSGKPAASITPNLRTDASSGKDGQMTGASTRFRGKDMGKVISYKKIQQIDSSSEDDKVSDAEDEGSSSSSSSSSEDEGGKPTSKRRRGKQGE